jgi:hypothetical protein
MMLSRDSLRSSAVLLAKTAMLTAVVALAACSDDQVHPMSARPNPENIMQARTTTDPVTPSVSSPVFETSSEPILAADTSSAPASNVTVNTAQQPMVPKQIMAPVPAFGTAPQNYAAPHYAFPPTGIGAR